FRSKTHTPGHDDEADAKDGVDLADDRVDGQEGGDEVVGQDDPQPELGVGDNAAEAAVLEQGDDQAGGADGKDGAHHDQQHHAEHAHDVLHAVAKVDAAHLRDGRAVIALGQHAGKIVMHAAGKNRKSTRLNSSHVSISYAVFCLKKKITHDRTSKQMMST